MVGKLPQLDIFFEMPLNKWPIFDSKTLSNSKIVLLHDLTSCLSIGDATSFKEVGNEFEAYLHEIKSDPNRTVSRQLP